MTKRKKDLEIRRDRMPGERRRIEFDPSVHPGIIRRCTLAGYDKDRIAAIIGITKSQLEQWLDRDEDMRAHVEAGVDLANAEVVESLYDQAVGWVDERTGQRRGASHQAAVFWVKARMGWDDQVHRRQQKADEKVDSSELEADLKDLLRKIEGARARDEKIIEAEYSEFD